MGWGRGGGVAANDKWNGPIITDRLQIFHVWWTSLFNHTGLLHLLHSVPFNFCAPRGSSERPVQPVGCDFSLDDSSTKMSISDAKTLSTLQKSKLHLHQETKIIKRGERRADDQNSGAISTDRSTTSSRRL